MEITIDTLFTYGRKGLFLFLLFTTVLQIIPAAHAEDINYFTYCTILVTGFWMLVSVYKINRGEEVVFNAMTLYFFYRLMNILFVRGFPGGFATGYIILVNTLIGGCFYHLFYHNENKTVFRWCINLLVALAVFEACIGASQVMFGVPYFEHLVGEELHSFSRNYFAYIIPGASKSTVLGSGTFRHFNDLGSFLVITFPILYAYWWESDRKWVLIALLINFMGIVLTFSRGALIATVIMSCILYFNFTKGRWLKMGLVFGLGLITFAVVAPLLTTYANETGNAGIRYNTWALMWEHAQTDYRMLIFGWGENYFRDEVIYWGTGLWIMNNTHNTFLQVFLENGVVGFLIFGLASGQFIFKSIQNKNIWSFAGIAMIVGFGFTQFFDHAFYNFNGAVFFAMLGVLQMSKEGPFYAFSKPDVLVKEAEKETKEEVTV